MLQLYRLHLEHYVQFWSPYHRKGIIVIEGIQCRFIRLVLEWRDCLMTRLDKLGLYSLEFQRMGGDLIENY